MPQELSSAGPPWARQEEEQAGLTPSPLGKGSSAPKSLGKRRAPGKGQAGLEHLCLIKAEGSCKQQSQRSFGGWR